MPHEQHKLHGSHHGKISYLESPERRAELPPEKLLGMMPIKETDTVLDFGAGTGYFSIPLAKRVAGTVYALDIDESMLKIINSKAQEERISNLVAIHGGNTGIPLPDALVDVVVASLVLHEINPLAAALNQINRVLKEGGHLACIELEPKGESAQKAPRISMAGMEKEFTEAGLRITKKFFPTEHLYVLIAQK
ncbi:class I SAM-dependent methyltransferase [Planococcus sp. YIM B11945]|uniref:class I SAM-dependent methyltransferase n=1 Tax=Planococcus sp. YIM B11945 TaxID=3435410 RepID=UPI003D7C650F